VFKGEQYAMIKATSDWAEYSNELRPTGSSVTLWVYILDNSRDQILFCKQNRNHNTDVTDKVCVGIKDGYYYGMVYNETQYFDAPVYEGWNFIGAIFTLDATSTYSRIRLVAYHQSAVTASYKTFSYYFHDDPEYDFIMGAKYDTDGTNLTAGFAGFILQLRLYSEVALTLSNFDDMVSFDCTGHTAYKLCEMCPLYITTDICLEDLSVAGGTDFNYLPAAYDFNGAITGNSRMYFSNLQTSTNDYRMYFGYAPAWARFEEFEPARTTVNGVYFNGDTFLEHTNYDLLKFTDYFTIEMWIRVSEYEVTQNWYLWQKQNTFGLDRPFFTFFFNPDNEFVVQMNEVKEYRIPNAFNSTAFYN